MIGDSGSTGSCELGTSLDPAFLGRELPAGCLVRVTLPTALPENVLIETETKN
jgi:hypothetical protein